MARGLASRQSGMVAVLLNDLHNPFFAETFDGLVQAADALGYRLLLGAGSARRQAELAAMRGFLEYRPDGIILLSPRLPTGAIATVAATVPMVVVGRSVRADGVDSVMTDEEVGARLVVDHLAELGHRRIVHIDGGRGAGAAPRRQGYRKAMERAGLGRFIEVLPGDFTERAGTEAAAALVAPAQPADGRVRRQRPRRRRGHRDARAQRPRGARRPCRSSATTTRSSPASATSR